MRIHLIAKPIVVALSFCTLQTLDASPIHGSSGASEPTLLELAKVDLGEPSDAGESAVFQQFFENIESGKTVDLESGADSTPRTDPKNAGAWDEAPTVEARWINWLCTSSTASGKVPPCGINIKGAKIAGLVDLSWRKIKFPVHTTDCRFTNDLTLDHTEIRGLQLDSTRISGLHGDGLTVDGDVLLLQGFYAEGQLWLRNATIHGLFECQNGNFNRGNVNLRYSQLPPAINFRAARVDRGLYLFDCNVLGCVQFDGATITGLLFCQGCHIDGHFDDDHWDNAIYAEGMQVSGNVNFNALRTVGVVDIKDATIGGSLDCGNCNLDNRIYLALDAELAKVGTDVLLCNGAVSGEVNFRGAHIGGDLNFNGAHIGGGIEKGLIATSIKVEGSILMGPARNGDSVSNFTTKGPIDLSSATVGKSLELNLADDPNRPISLDLRSAKTGELSHGQRWPKSVVLDGFSFALLKDITPDAKTEEAWLALENTIGFSSQPYEQMAAVLRSMGFRDEAIQVMVEKSWQGGQAILKNDFTRLGKLWRETSLWQLHKALDRLVEMLLLICKLLGSLLWYYCFGYIIGYGYRPEGALLPSVVMIVLAAALFQSGYNANAVVPTDDKARIPIYSTQTIDSYPRFNAFAYSIEKFVPLLKLEVGDYWVPNSNRLYGKFLRVFLWIHIVAGWLLSTLWIGALSGLLKA